MQTNVKTSYEAFSVHQAAMIQHSEFGSALKTLSLLAHL